MKRVTLQPENEADWLMMRRKDITSTMSAALFDMSPYCTAFEIYHAKKNGVEVAFEENDRMAKGKRMERFAAEEIALEHGFTALRHCSEYIRIPEAGMGSSFDFECVHPEFGLGGLEIKAVEYGEFKEKWTLEEAPPHIEVQVQHQQILKPEWKWTGIGCFYNLYNHALIIRKPDLDFQNAITEAIKKFWKDVEDGNEPRPDFYRDAAVIAELYNKPIDVPVNYMSDDKMEALVSKFLLSKNMSDQGKLDQDAARAEIHRYMGNNAEGFTKEYRIQAGWTKSSESKRGYRQCNIQSLTKRGKE